MLYCDIMREAGVDRIGGNSSASDWYRAKPCMKTLTMNESRPVRIPEVDVGIGE
jgi:hypothetical protein